jgi:hypothetical protein
VLYKDACLAADLAQLLLEQACAAGSLGFDEMMGRSVNVIKIQLEAQMGFYGFHQEDLDAAESAFAARFSSSPGSPPSLVFLRPLCTSRRIPLRNQFGAYYQQLFSGMTSNPIVENLTLEGALHLAFMTRFSTTALGGPMDILGIKRLTAIFEEESSPVRTWQMAASILIEFADVVVVLFDDSEGLLWEMSEIVRQGALKRLVFVIPPGENDQREWVLSEAGVQQLRQIGFDLPIDPIGSGFLLLDSTGAVEQRLSFEALWSGELLNVVWTRVQG